MSMIIYLIFAAFTTVNSLHIHDKGIGALGHTRPQALGSLLAVPIAHSIEMGLK